MLVLTVYSSLDSVLVLCYVLISSVSSTNSLFNTTHEQSSAQIDPLF